MKQISILGCGWLGLPLGASLVEKGIIVKGSTTSLDKKEVLEKAHITPFIIHLKEDQVEGPFAEFLENSTLLIIAVPPKLRGENSENFVAKIRNLIPFIESSSIEKILFISSTSTYGESNSLVTEATLPNPETESGRQLVQIEQLLLQNKQFKTTILRLAGLIGKDRHPVKYLAGRNHLENPSAPVNLIHLEDCINIIQMILEKEIWDEGIFNVAAPFHPSREEYYTSKAKELGLPLPQFSSEKDTTKGKVVISEKLEKVLNYSFNLDLY